MNVVYKRDVGRNGVKLMFHDECGEPLEEVKTKQEFLEECDINNIIARYRKTGVLPNTFGDIGSYGDFSEVTCFQDAMIKIQDAEDMFMSLPAGIRSKFDNDPGKFLEFADNPENQDKLVEMGIISRESVKVSESSTSEEGGKSEHNPT